jgi:hypothetical protein
MTVISDIQLAVLKTSAIVLVAAAVAVLVSVAYNNGSMRSTLEGMGNADGDSGGKPGKIPDEDDDLKCAGPKRDGTKCTVPDVIRLGYELASDPALSQGEMEKISSVFKSRTAEKGSEKLGEKLGEIFNRFMGDVMLLRFSVMFNTSPNEPELKKVMDNMIQKKDGKACYSPDDMKQVKGLLVGTAEQKTLSVAQSEAMRCYMQRFNSVRACMGICDSKRA